MTTIMSPPRMHPPKHPTLPQLLTTPENDCDPENDENLSTHGIGSDAEVPPEDDSEAAEDSHNDESRYTTSTCRPVLRYSGRSFGSLQRNTDMPLPSYDLKRAH